MTATFCRERIREAHARNENRPIWVNCPGCFAREGVKCRPRKPTSAERRAFDALPEACNEALSVAHRSVSNAEKRLAAVRASCDELIRKSAVTP